MQEKESRDTAPDSTRSGFLSSIIGRMKSRKDSGKESPAQEREAEAEAKTKSEPKKAVKTELPFPLLQYVQHWCQETNRDAGTFSAPEDFCDESIPDQELKRLFAEIEKTAASVMRDYDQMMEIHLTAKNSGEDEIPPPRINGKALFFCDADWKTAWCMVLPPLGGGNEVSEQSFQEQMQESGITFGVQNEKVKKLLSGSSCFVFTVVARAVLPVNGTDGYVTDYFSRDIGEPHLVENEQGIVDFKDLHWLVPIEKGCVVCDVTAPTKGSNGTDIRSHPIPAVDGKSAKLPMGENIGYNDDQTALIAKEGGQIVFKNGKFHIRNITIIPGNVDSSTGNLDVKGNLMIRGNVNAGFSVHAQGDVTIEGTVEGSLISADGNITLCKGINGNMVGTIVAGKDINSKYMENAKIHAGGNVNAGSAINCEISCYGRISVTAGRGTAIGGFLSAMQGIEAKIIGNKIGRVTVLTIGPTPEFLNEKNLAQQEYESVKQKLQMLATSSQDGQLSEPAKLESAILRMKENVLNKKITELQKQEELSVEGQIIAGIIYPISQVAINGSTKVIIDEQTQCRLYWNPSEKDIKIGIK